jgi:hypothetical protein
MPETEIQTPPRVTFDEAQQKRVDELIRESMGRAGSEARQTAARLQKELEAAKDAAKEAETLRAEVARLKGDREGLESNLSVKEKEARSARAETVAVKKQNAIQAAATEHNFFNPQIVSKLTEDKIKWDDGKQKFIVLGDDGSERLGADGNSLSVSAYLKEFGAANSYLVRGDVKTGVGSSENQRPYTTTTERDRLAKLFGKGSDSRAANRLGVENPQLYKQYKREARAIGLIP